PRAALAHSNLDPTLVLGPKTFTRCLINGLIDVGEDAQLHEVGKQLQRLFMQPFIRVADNDRRVEGDGFVGGAGDEVGRGGASAGASAIGAAASSLRFVSAGRAGAAGVGVSGGAETMRMGSGGAGAGGSSAKATGLRPPSCSSRYSAVILSSELDGTLAPAMPSALALARTSLLSIPSFFAMS